jgi:rare lipoprotein A
VVAARSLPGAVTVDPATGRPTIVATGTGTAVATTVAFSAAAQTQTMVASWYGPGFEAKDTASGERFDPSLLTAAHKTLPFGTWLRVGHAGRFVTVRVNDRGPYVEGRDLDLSQAAAESLGLGGVGTVSVEVVAAP